MNRKPLLDVNMLSSVLDYLNLGVYITDLDRRILLWNRKAEEITGYKASDVIGKACHENVLMHVDKNELQLCSTELCPLFRSMKLDKESEEELLVYARQSDGQRLAVSVNTAPMHDSTGKVIGGIEAFNDSSAWIRDLEFAKKIQRHVLPENLPESSSFQFDVRYYPYDLVGGDFYDIREVSPGKFGFLLADVMGHGVSAALYTMWLKSLSVSLSDLSDRPDEFITAMNHELSKVVVEGGFATAFYGVFSVDNFELTYTNAGHPDPILYDSAGGSLTRLKSRGLPLGVFEEFDYSQVKTTMRPGHLLLCFTDGATEVANLDGLMLDEEGLARILSEQISHPGDELLEKIFKSVNDFCGDVALPDDVTLLSLSVSSEQ